MKEYLDVETRKEKEDELRILGETKLSEMSDLTDLSDLSEMSGDE